MANPPTSGGFGRFEDAFGRRQFEQRVSATSRGLVAKNKHSPPPERCVFMAKPLLVAGFGCFRTQAMPAASFCHYWGGCVKSYRAVRGHPFVRRIMSFGSHPTLGEAPDPTTRIRIAGAQEAAGGKQAAVG